VTPRPPFSKSAPGEGDLRGANRHGFRAGNWRSLALCRIPPYELHLATGRCTATAICSGLDAETRAFHLNGVNLWP
jgi:hypothetical protein